MSDRFDHTLELTHKPKADADEGGTSAVQVRRIELITGTGRRRQWSDDDKARVIVESLLPGANVSAVARRHGLTPQQLFGWRREARELFGDGSGTAAVNPAKDTVPSGPSPAFTPVVLAARPVPDTAATPPSPTRPPAARDAGVIEIIIGTVIVRVVGPVAAAALDVVLAAVRRAS